MSLVCTTVSQESIFITGVPAVKNCNYHDISSVSHLWALDL